MVYMRFSVHTWPIATIAKPVMSAAAYTHTQNSFIFSLSLRFFFIDLLLFLGIHSILLVAVLQKFDRLWLISTESMNEAGTKIIDYK